MRAAAFAITVIGLVQANVSYADKLETPMGTVTVTATMSTAPSKEFEELMRRKPHHGACIQTNEHWPFGKFSTQEREYRLQKFLKISRMNLCQHAEYNNEKNCDDLRSRLESLNGVQVLTPEFYGLVSQAGLHPWQSTKKAADETPYLGKCTNLDLDRVYVSSTGVLDDAVFNAKPRSEKESIAMGYTEATRNIEIYDLSKYIGAGGKGYFGDGVTDHFLHTASPYKECENPHYELNSVVSKVFNSNTCESSRAPELHVGRLGIGAHGSDPEPDYWVMMPTFYAFVDISGKLYRVAYQAANDINEMADLDKPVFPNLYIDAIPSISTVPAEGHHTCYYAESCNGGE